MYILLTGCQNPTILRVIYFVKLLLDIVFNIIPIILIIVLAIDILKMVVSSDEKGQKKVLNIAIKRIIYAVAVFFVPVIVSLINKQLGSLGVDYISCLENANSETIEVYQELQEDEDDLKAQELRAVQLAKEANISFINESRKYYVTNSMIEKTKKLVTDSATEQNYTNKPACTEIPNSMYKNKKEPDSLATFIYWHKKGKEEYNPDNFVAMYDKETCYRLGTWPIDANLANLSGNVKTYGNGKVIFPTSGDGGSSYNNAGVDIVSKVGSPIYAVADGTITFSEWGHTVNLGQTETAYSVFMKLDEPFSYEGQWAAGIGGNLPVKNNTDQVVSIFYTHLSGIRYYVPKGKTKHVKQGDLIGFMGVANSVVHLHLSFYNNGVYQIYTPGMKTMYKSTAGENREAGG